MTTEIIKKIANLFGFNITRYNKKIENAKYDWLKKYDIENIIDIGANIGLFSMFIHKIFPRASIYAFEPLRECYEQLKLQGENIKTIKVFNIALGDKKETTTIRKNSFAPSSSILEMSEKHKTAFPYTKTFKLDKVEMDTLDNILANKNLLNILIKIDVQGYEHKVLLGAQKILENTKIIILEVSFEKLYIGSSDFDEVYDMLKEFNFKYCGSWGQLNDPNNGKPLQQDAIFLKESN